MSALLLAVLLSSPSALEERVVAIQPEALPLLPLDGATVPSNARLVLNSTVPVADLSVVQLVDDGAGGVAERALTFERVPASLGDFTGASAFIVALPDDVEAGERVVIAPRCGACRELFAEFTVAAGADDVAPAFAAAAVADGDVLVEPRVGRVHNGLFEETRQLGWTVTLTLPQLTEASSAQSLVRIESADGSFVAGVVDHALPTLPFIVDGAAERTLCFRVIAADVAGNESALEETCAELRHPVGCAQIPVAPLGLALLGLAWRRRVRR